jgi:hypothetical protein
MNATEGYQRIVKIMDEAYTAYEEGLAALRKRVVEDMQRKLREGGVLDHRPEGSTPRSAPTRRRR